MAEGRAGKLTAWTDPGPDAPARRLDSPEEIRQAVVVGDPIWIDLEGAEKEQIEFIRSLFPFHPLAVEDVTHNVQRPKIEEYDDHLFIVSFAIEQSEGTAFIPREVDIFIGERYLVSFHDAPVPALEEIGERCRRGRAAFEKGSDALLHSLLDGLVDSYFPLLERFDDRIDELEDRISTKPGGDTLKQTFEVRRDLLRLRRLLLPHREILGHLTTRNYIGISESSRTYFRDVHDHLLRISESADGYRELLDTVVETYLGRTAHTTNEVMKFLGIIATLGLPLTVVTGFFGMNFVHMPWLEEPKAVVGLVAGLAGLEIGLFLAIRRKGWI